MILPALRIWIILSTVVLAAPARHGVAHADEISWQHRGPVGTSQGSTQLIAVSPDWPRDRTMIGSDAGWLMRSDDGGDHWRRLPLRVPRWLWLTPSPNASPLGFGIVWSTKERENVHLLRGTGALEAWTSVLELPPPIPATGRETQMIPAGTTGRSLFLQHSNAWLYRSDDYGSSWRQVQIPSASSPQRLTHVRASPGFETDRTIVIALTGARSADFSKSRGSNPNVLNSTPIVPTEHLDSAGLFISRDAGDTWESINGGLEVDGVPHPHIQTLEISPTFDVDQTVYAWAWGPAAIVEALGEERLDYANALFASSSAGSSWEVAWDRPTLVNDVEGDYPLALAPGLSTTAPLLALVPQPVAVRNFYKLGFTPDVPRTRCTPYHLVRGEAGWQHRQASPSHLGIGNCGELLALDRTAPGLRVATIGSRDFKGMSVFISTNHAETWSDVGLPPGETKLPRVISVDSASVALLQGDRGIWALGPAHLSRAPGSAHCPIEPGFALRTFKDERALVATLGCPLAPEQQVMIRLRSLGTTRGLWIDDDSDAWFELRPGREADTGPWWPRLKQNLPWTGEPDLWVPASVQRFWNGLAARWREPDSREIIERLVDSKHLPDPGTWTRHALH